MINYEVVEITMPFVFLGAFIGVKLGSLIGDTPRVLIFATTVAWSIQTTAKKAKSLLQKEKAKAQEEKDTKKESLLPNGEGASTAINSGAPAAGATVGGPEEPANDAALAEKVPELEYIYTQEKYHFTTRRVIFVFENLALLMINSYCDKNVEDVYVRYGVEIGFALAMIALTYV